MSNPNSPIGIFDSGLGGLSILNEIHRRLPNEKLIYLADSHNAPYGEKSKEEIIALAIKNTEFLLNKSCKIIVVACNTATTNAIQILRQQFNVKFIGIEPAIKPAAIESRTKQIGILATKGTLSSELFAQNMKKMSQTSRIIEVTGKGIVEAIEDNTTEDLNFKRELKKQLLPFINSNIDHLVLGCSHYPLITDKLYEIFDNSVKIIDSGFAVAKQTENILNQLNLLQVNTNKREPITIYTNHTSQDALKNILFRLGIKNYVVQ